MFNNPIFRSYPARQARPVPVPVQQPHQSFSPKVISVPVHFISSQQSQTPSPESAALKIQKVFRGFCVRKCVKKITSIRDQVFEVEIRIKDAEIAELIQRDEKERLRVNETLMSLLFKLDSIRGVDYGVRELRKGVIRKAIALQEKLDSIGTIEKKSDEIEAEKGNSSAVHDEIVEGEMKLTGVTDSVGTIKNGSDEIQAENAVHDEIVDDEMNLTTTVKDGSGETEADHAYSSAVHDESVDAERNLTAAIKNKSDEIEAEKANSGSVHDEIVDDPVNLTAVTDSIVTIKNENESDEIESEIDKFVVKEIDENCNHVEDDKKRNIQILEKLMDDNEKMMKLMTQMFETNEKQTRMLNSLSQRVEQLEKAFICDRSRRKKKRHSA